MRSCGLLAVGAPHPLCDVKFQTRTLLKITENAKEVLGLRITARTEHPDKTLGLGPGRFAKLFKSDGCLDIVTQDRLAGFDIPAQHRINALSKQRFGKLLVVLDASSLKLPVFAICLSALLSAVRAGSACSNCSSDEA